MKIITERDLPSSNRQIKIITDKARKHTNQLDFRLNQHSIKNILVRKHKGNLQQSNFSAGSLLFKRADLVEMASSLKIKR